MKKNYKITQGEFRDFQATVNEILAKVENEGLNEDQYIQECIDIVDKNLNFYNDKINDKAKNWESKLITLSLEKLHEIKENTNEVIAELENKYVDSDPKLTKEVELFDQFFENLETSISTQENLDLKSIAKSYKVSAAKLKNKSQRTIELMLGCEEGELDRYNKANEQPEEEIKTK